MPNFQNPLIIQSDRTLLLDVHAPLSKECAHALVPFAELEKSPEHLHTYRLTALSLWNAAGAGLSAEDAVNTLRTFSRYDVPESVETWIFDIASRFGSLRLLPAPSEKAADGSEKEFLFLVAKNEAIFREIVASPVAKKYLSVAPYRFQNGVFVSEEESSHCFRLSLTDRGTVKQSLLSIGFPVKDEVPLVPGTPLDISLRETTLLQKTFCVRPYQVEAAEAVIGNGGAGTGFGTVVLPCGAGKTIVGLKAMSLVKENTLIITTNISAVHQWISELLDKTNLTRDQIAEYTGEEKSVKSVTVATYQILTWRADKDGSYPHFSIFRKNGWGLIIYDEVHTLPAPVFRVVAELQAVRRLGLTATLVREDGMEGHVFSLVGPKRYDVPWKDLEGSGFIAHAECIEIRVDIPENQKIEYAVSENRKKHRIASDNEKKDEVVKILVEKSPLDKILVIGQYVSQLHRIAKILKSPIITGKTPTRERDKIYEDFRAGKIRVLVVSKVANFAIDLPDASMAIQVSGTFGSRQEEAQRLGRILRPKERNARFFTLITHGTVEEEFGASRQKFLAEQGYSYRLMRVRSQKDAEVAAQVGAMLLEG
mgnify:CR=1 FL=1